jgi:hypothetical protein
MLLGVPVPTAGGLYRAREEVRAFRVAVAQSGLRLVLPTDWVGPRSADS